MLKPVTNRQKIWAHIQASGEDSFNSTDLAKALGLNKSTVSDYLAILHKRGKVHIAGWKGFSANRRADIRIYRLGTGTDATKPVMSPEERRAMNYEHHRKWRKRQANKKSSRLLKSAPNSVFDLAHHL